MGWLAGPGYAVGCPVVAWMVVIGRQVVGGAALALTDQDSGRSQKG